MVMDSVPGTSAQIGAVGTGEWGLISPKCCPQKNGRWQDEGEGTGIVSKKESSSGKIRNFWEFQMLEMREDRILMGFTCRELYLAIFCLKQAQC